MTTLLNKIKTMQLEARKAKQTDKATLLTTLYAEAMTVGKNKANRDSTDQEVQEVVQKFLKNNRDFQKVANESKKIELQKEESILLQFMPKMLTEDEIIALIEAARATTPNLGMIMKYFKDEYAGRYDGAVLSKLVKEALQSPV